MTAVPSLGWEAPVVVQQGGTKPRAQGKAECPHLPVVGTGLGSLAGLNSSFRVAFVFPRVPGLLGPSFTGPWKKDGFPNHLGTLKFKPCPTAALLSWLKARRVPQTGVTATERLLAPTSHSGLKVYLDKPCFHLLPAPPWSLCQEKRSQAECSSWKAAF